MYWLENIGPALLAALWQSAIAYLLLYTCRKSRLTTPNETYIVGVLLQYILAGLFLYNIFGISNVQNGGTEMLPQNEFIKKIISSQYISYTYIILLLLNSVVFIGKTIHSKKENDLTETDTRLIPASLELLVKKWKNRLDIRRPVKVVVRESIIIPFTKGFLQPTILLPISFISGMDIQQMEAVLLHELWHIKRHDYLVLLIQLCLEKIMYFNPFYLLIGKAVHEDRELSCDINTIYKSNSNSINYVESLLLFSRKNSNLTDSQARLAVTGKHNSELVNRAAYLLEGEKNKKYQASIAMNAIAVMALALSIVNADKKSTTYFSVADGAIPAGKTISYVSNTVPVSEKKEVTVALPTISKKEKHTPENTENKSVKINTHKKTASKNEVSNAKVPTPSENLEPIVPNRETANINTTENNPLVQIAPYIQASTTRAELKFKPLEITLNKAVFALETHDAATMNQLFDQAVSNIARHFDIECSSFQYSAFADDNRLVETSTIELKSTYYVFLLIKGKQKIYLAIAPRIVHSKF